MNFQEQWLRSVNEKNSVLVAGIDPPLPQYGWKRSIGDIDPADLVEEWLEDVIDHAAAIKPNVQFYTLDWGPRVLERIGDVCRAFNTPVIHDRKLADILDTNDAALHATVQQGGSAVTIAPYAGNMQEVTQAAARRGLGTITMGIMSNTEFRRRKYALIPTPDSVSSEFLLADGFDVNGKFHVYQFIMDAWEARTSGVSGIVVGAPSAQNGITVEDLAKVRHYGGAHMMVLMPGIYGKQKGSPDAAWPFFGPDRLMPNLSTELLFDDARLLSREERRDRAAYFAKQFNEKRL